MRWPLRVVTLALLAIPASAQSDPDMERAKQRYQLGAEAAKDGRLREALAEFAAAYELSRMPDLLWNMAECSRQLGERDRALSLYRQYVKEAPDGEKVVEANDRIRELEAQQAPASPPPATPVVTEPPPPSTPPSAAPVVATETRARPMRSAETPFYKKWWFWTGVGAAVVAGVVAGVVVSRGGDEEDPIPDCADCLGPPLKGTWQ